jgi:hypothetical protein
MDDNMPSFHPPSRRVWLAHTWKMAHDRNLCRDRCSSAPEDTLPRRSSSKSGLQAGQLTSLQVLPAPPVEAVTAATTLDAGIGV